MGDESSHYGLRVVPVTDEAEAELIIELGHRLDCVETLLSREATVAGAPVRKDSELWFDDRFTAWRQLSHAVLISLNFALDNLRAFRDLVRVDDKVLLPQFAHYALLRSAIEGSSLALWLVAPDDPRLRIQRLLRAAMREVSEEDKLRYTAIKFMRADTDDVFKPGDVEREEQARAQVVLKHQNQIRAVAESLGLEVPQMKRPVGFATIVREACEVTSSGGSGEILWRNISGLAHPSQMRAASQSQLDHVSESDDGVIHTVMSAKANVTSPALAVALTNSAAAIEIFGARKITPGDPARYETPIVV